MSESETSHPRESSALIGHEAAEAEFHQAYASGRMHHAWLISGPKGIGKATLAYRMARQMLSPEGDERAFRRMMAGSHADLLVLEPPDDPDKDEAKREIPVEQARAAGEFLALTPGEGAWRVVIVDSADEMNTSAANALLKVLEEPPPRAVLLLIAHNPGRLLPTIRSRCRSLRLHPLSADRFREVMALHAPDVCASDANRLGLLSRFSPGVALALLQHEGIEMYADFVKLIGQGRHPVPGLMAFADRISAGAVHTRWQMLGHLIGRFFERATELGLGHPGFTEAAPDEEDALRAILADMPLPAIAARHAEAAEQFSVASRLHLDYKSVLMSFLNDKRLHAA